jgi:methyl-accepting chemotaxis protein
MSVSRAQWWVMYELFFVLAVTLFLVANLIFSYFKNMKLLFENQTSVLDRVSRGDLTRQVPVATNDEFGLNRLRESIRNCAIESAKTIQDSVVKDLRTFQGDAIQQDDITLVVIKLL